MRTAFQSLAIYCVYMRIGYVLNESNLKIKEKITQHKFTATATHTLKCEREQ